TGGPPLATLGFFPPMRKPVSSMFFAGAPATRSRTVSAKPRRRSAQVWLILAIVAAASFTPKRSAISSARRSSGSKLIVQQIDHEGGDSGAVLHGRVDAIWKRSPRFRAAGGASAIVRAMFGDDEGLWLGQIEHLTRGVIFRHVWRQRRAAFGTGRGVMI